MAQTATATYKTNASKAVRVPVRELLVAWGRTADTFPDDWAAQAVDESARIKSINWTRQLDMKGPLAQGTSPVAALTVELDNYDNRYSPFNSAGALYASLLASTTTAGGLGYATGAGGTVSQTSNKSTSVTLDKLTGKITSKNRGNANRVKVINAKPEAPEVIIKSKKRNDCIMTIRPVSTAATTKVTMVICPKI